MAGFSRKLICGSNRVRIDFGWRVMLLGTGWRYAAFRRIQHGVQRGQIAGIGKFQRVEGLFQVLGEGFHFLQGNDGFVMHCLQHDLCRRLQRADK